MITDEETNFVYFSDLLPQQFYEEWLNIKEKLDKYKIPYGFLKDTKDIWCRDYMPIQKDVNNFIGFLYKPWYLDGYEKLRTNPELICKNNGIAVTFEEINLDGGNVVKSKNKVIITERIFSENIDFKYNNRKELNQRLENIFQAKIIIIPGLDKDKDMTCHSDGVIRFIDENNVLLYNIEKEYKIIKNKFIKVLDENKLEKVYFPWFIDKSTSESAIGCYINYLRVGNVILMPIFKKPKIDNEAFEILSKTFPDCIIDTVYIYKIAQKGGLLNCISWNIRI